MEQANLESELLHQVQVEDRAYRATARQLALLAVVAAGCLLGTRVMDATLGPTSSLRIATGLLAGLSFMGGSLLAVTSAKGVTRYASVTVVFGGVCMLASEILKTVNLFVASEQLNMVSERALYLGILALIFCINPALFEMAMGRIQLTSATEKLLHSRARRELSEQSYEAVFQNTSEGIVILSDQGVITDANDSACAILQMQRPELEGKSMDRVFGADQIVLPGPEAEKSPGLQDVVRTLERHKKQYLQLNVSRFAEGGYVAFVRDVTQKQVLEEQVHAFQRLDSIGRLAGGVAHDFNNMLTPVIGFSEMLLMQTEGDHPWKKNLEQIHKAADHARLLTRQLLAFGRRQTFSVQTVCVNDVVLELEVVLRRTIRENVELKLNLAPDAGCILADANQVEQILMNLCTNAEQAMPGGGQLIIETTNTYLDEAYAARRQSVRPGAYVTISISDTGVGMDPETMEHVFDPFFSTKEQGTGLGLATVYGIVKQHDGNIWMYSEPGHGTTCRIYFPRTDAVEEVRREPVRSHAAAGAHFIMVVEDEPAVLDYVTSILQHAGFGVVGTTEATECAELMARPGQPVELLITDVIMPKMNGRQLYEKLRVSHPELKVVYMSGYAADIMTHNNVLESDVPFLQKPIPVRTLLETVNGVFAGKA